MSVSEVGAWETLDMVEVPRLITITLLAAPKVDEDNSAYKDYPMLSVGKTATGSPGAY